MKKSILFLAALAWAVTGTFAGTPRAAQSAGNGAFGPGSRVQPYNNTNALRIAVTAKGYDDIGSILSSMGWKFTEIQPWDMANYDLLAQFDVIFINCAEDAHYYSTDTNLASPIPANLERFVREGGTVYASDWAYEYIDRAIPGYIHYFDTPSPDIGDDGQSVIADIIDPGLASFMNSPTVEIQFPAPGWVPIESVSDGVTVYLAGDIRLYDGTIVNDKPLAAYFTYGEGRVVYTSFHNEGQSTADEARLLNYLVFITSTEELSSLLAENMTAAGHGSQQELLGSISAGATTPHLAFSNPSVADMVVGLNWQEGTLRLSVFKPDGSLADQQEGAAPLIITIPNAEAGSWSYQVEAIDVPHDNYPYVIQISVPAAVAAAPSATPETPADTGTAQNRAGAGLYVVIGGILCLGLLFAVALIGAVIFLVRRRKA